ncbi:MAG: hypothetical protein M8357_00165 [Desulfobulbaceae bacterium]|nr:hypothetical protein [Desulfobulbaceae bacterium]
MKIISKKTCLYALVAAGALTMGTLGFQSSAQAESYNAEVYVAGMGGHFAKATVEIDPSAAAPIKLKALDKVDIGDAATHPVHDARIDANKRDLMFWSTYKIDKEVGGPHVGATDLKSGEKVMDVVAPVPEKGQGNTKSMYCGSGQTKDFFFPITMSSKGYIDVFQKSDMKRVASVFLEGTEADPGVPYKFYHGVNSPDMTKMLISVNEADSDHGKPIGKIHLMLLDAQALEKGEVKLIKRAAIPGNAGKTVNFRSTYSPDGKLIGLSGGDTMYIVDAETLELVVRQPMGELEENHDAMFTPDSKYVIATSRTKTLNNGNFKKISREAPNCEDEVFTGDKLGADDFTMDGQLKLFDVAAKKFVGQSTSTCLACHNEEGLETHAVLCGLDANFQ